MYEDGVVLFQEGNENYLQFREKVKGSLSNDRHLRNLRIHLSSTKGILEARMKRRTTERLHEVLLDLNSHYLELSCEWT